MNKEQAIEIIETHSDDISSSSLLGQALNMAIDALKAQLPNEGTTKDAISRQVAIDALDVDAEFLRRVLDVTDLVGVERTKYEWGIGLIEACIYDIKDLPPARPELDSENLVQTIETGITATNSNDAYSLGMRNGMRWCKSLIDGVEPKFEGADTKGEQDGH